MLSVLGEDEIGTVHLARVEGPSGFQRWVALRLVNRALATDERFKDAFYAAARFGGQVSHANVANTLEVGETGGNLWMAMEYLHGEPLSAILARAREYQMPLPWDIACRIASDVALGVDALHEVRKPGGDRVGIAHGRLGPHQVVVTYDGKTKVLGVPVNAPGALSAHPTRALPYAAPEVADGAVATPRADIYSVGVLLWELVSGRSLFAGDSEADTRAKIRAHQVPALKPMSLGCPERVDKIVQRALAVDENKRFGTARELGQALQAALVSEALVVTDDDVGRYVLKLFGDNFEEREYQLQSASEVTEVFRRESQPAPAPAAGLDPDGTIPMESVPHTVRLPNAAHVPPTYVPMAVPLADPDETQLRGAVFSTVVLRSPPPPPPPPPQPMNAPPPEYARASPSDTQPGGVAPRRSVLPYVLVGGTAFVVAITLAGIYRMRLHEPAPMPPPAASTSASALAAAPSAVASATAAAAATASTPTSAATPSASAPPTASATPSPSATATATATNDSPSPRPSGRVRPPRPPVAPTGATGLLTVICIPACDQVWDGGRALGPSPVLKVPVTAGSHRIRMKVNDPPTERVVVVDVAEDDTKVVRQSME